MRGSIHHSTSRAIWALAQRQHWVVARRQLLAIGLNAKMIERRVANRRLFVVWRGVYSVGRPELSTEGRMMAAVLACGSGAVLSHDSAAELWEMRLSRDGVIHVTARNPSARRLPGIRVHRRPTLEEHAIVEHRGIPVTSPIQTLIDIATTVAANELEAATNEADKLDLVTPDALRAVLEDHPGQAGVRRLRTLLDRRSFALTDSELERRFLPISARAGLATPETQARVNGFRVDFYYRALGLVVETDGLRYHRTPSQQARDRLRDQTHTAAGLTTLRFTHAQVRYEPGYVEEILAATAQRLMNRPPSTGADSSIAPRSAGSSGPRRPRAG